MRTFYNYSLEGHSATESEARNAALQLDWMEIDSSAGEYPFLRYIDTLNGVGIWYNYGSDSYYFTDENSS